MFFHLVECLAEAGAAAGLPADLAGALARATVIGAGELLAQSELPPANARRQNVTSPGGTTAAALDVLMADRPTVAARARPCRPRLRRELSGCRRRSNCLS